MKDSAHSAAVTDLRRPGDDERVGPVAPAIVTAAIPPGDANLGLTADEELMKSLSVKDCASSVTFTPSGEQFAIAHGGQRAVIVEVGGGIRCYDVDGRPVLDPYPEHALCDGGHGTPLIPWPNRLGDGRYRFDGSDHQLSLTEPKLGNAIHGLLRWQPWRWLEHQPERVAVGARLYPQPGYPFALDVRIEYELGDDGLVVRTAAANFGERACPFGSGQHPYLSPGRGTVDECVLEFEAATQLLTDERQLPVGRESVRGGALDFASARQIGDLQIDAAFSDLARDDSGRATVRLTGPDGATVELWADSSYSVIQLFTGDTLAPERRRLGLAAEPMTCPPNAFQTGEGLLRLEPGDAVTSVWGVRLH
jgi:aldose 1-epimerase